MNDQTYNAGRISLIEDLEQANKKIQELRNILQSEALLNTSLHRDRVRLEAENKKLHDDLVDCHRRRMAACDSSDNFRKERDYWADQYFAVNDFISKLKELTGLAAKGTVLETVHAMILKHEKKMEKKNGTKTQS